MSNVYLLVKTNILNFLGSFMKKSKGPKYFLSLLLVLGFAALIIFNFTATSISSIQMFLENKVENPGLMTMFSNSTLALMMFLFVTITRCVMSGKHQDNQILLSLPFKKSQIVISKYLFNYLFDLSIFISVLLPSYIVYYVMIPGASAYVLLRGSIFILLLPFISNAIAVFLGNLFDKIARSLKYYAIIQTIFIIILIGCYLLFNYSMQYYLLNFTGTAEDVINSIVIVSVVIDYVLFGHLTDFLIIFGLAIFCLVITVWYLSYRLGKLTSKYENSSSKLVIKERKPIISLMFKEIRNYFNIPVYLMNTIIPLVLFIGMAVAVAVLGEDLVFSFVSALPENFANNFDCLIIMVFSALIGGFVTTSCSLSLEGKNFWIIKSSPFEFKEIIGSKIMANVLIGLVGILIAFPFFAMFVDFQYLIFFLIIPILINIMGSILGMILNLNFPKMDWEHEDAVVKRSMASMVGLLLPMIIAIIPYIFYLTSLNFILTLFEFLWFVVMFFVIIILLLLLWLKHRGEDAYNKIGK